MLGPLEVSVFRGETVFPKRKAYFSWWIRTDKPFSLQLEPERWAKKSMFPTIDAAKKNAETTLATLIEILLQDTGTG